MILKEWEFLKLVAQMKGKEKAEKIPFIVEINKKLAIPLSTIMLSVLGILMSVGHHRSGKGVNYGFGIGVIFIYIVLLNIGKWSCLIGEK